MMGLGPSFFLFLFMELLVVVVPEAELVPLPFAPAIRGTVVDCAVGGVAAALMASTPAVAADFDAVIVAGAGAGTGLEFVASFALFIFATLRQTKLKVVFGFVFFFLADEFLCQRFTRERHAGPRCFLFWSCMIFS
ncbi:hypothetical protein F5X98DRAFT_67628 [Xylaria grammica]|nr:hypothetical protein F5X98DRAFT_67628 [Xylaria grammica]